MQKFAGYTLLELLVVVGLIGIGMVLLLGGIYKASPGQQLRAQTSALAAELRLTRTQAMISGRTQLFQLDLQNKTWRAGPVSTLQMLDAAAAAAEENQDADNLDEEQLRSGDIQPQIDLEVVTVREESPTNDVAAWRFFTDGSSTGGRIILKIENAAWHIDLAWLTGEVTTDRGEGE